MTRREQTVLVLQGGGALGAYQAGVYEGIAETGLTPNWIAGVSIGAINAALIAGNPPERRVERLRELILLTSAATLLWAHWGLQKGARGQLKLGLFLTIALGMVFLCLQAAEYFHAYTALNLKLSSGAYGATFFMLTGFHGLHVAIGATVLIVIFARSLRGDFAPDDQFAFEAASWYWQFVDVVWLLLYVLVYWL